MTEILTSSLLALLVVLKFLHGFHYRLLFIQAHFQFDHHNSLQSSNQTGTTYSFSMSVFLKPSFIFRKNSFLNWVFSPNSNSEIYPRAEGMYFSLTLAPLGTNPTNYYSRQRFPNVSTVNGVESFTDAEKFMFSGSDHMLKIFGLSCLLIKKEKTALHTYLRIKIPENQTVKNIQF